MRGLALLLLGEPEDFQAIGPTASVNYNDRDLETSQGSLSTGISSNQDIRISRYNL